MFKMIKNIRLFVQYRKAIKKNLIYIQEKFSLDVNNFYELYTTLTIADAPEEMLQKYGALNLAEKEIKTYINLINKDLPKLDLEEMVNVYEIKSLDNNNLNYGIAFGFSQMNNRRIYLILSLLIITLISIPILIFI